MDTALCVTSFIGARVMERLPKLRVGFSHGGGIGAVLDRLQHIYEHVVHRTARRFLQLDAQG